MVQTTSWIENELEELGASLLKSEPLPSIGLLNGESGKALFYFLRFITSEFDEKWQDAFDTSIQYCIEKVMSQPVDAPLSFAEGLPGLCIALQVARKHDYLDESAIQVLEDIELVMINRVNDDTIYDLIGYDYFYGLSGLGNYFLKYSTHARKDEVIITILQSLTKNAMTDQYGVKWKDPYGFGTLPYNFGVAHGMLSVINLYSQAAQQIKNYRFKDTLSQAASWLLSKENNKECPFRFPCTVGENDEGRNTANRLAWCYGELTIATTLLHVFQATNDQSYYDHALRIALSTTDKKKKEMVTSSADGQYEAGLCHGLAGVSYLYKVLAAYFNHDQLLDCYFFWQSALQHRCPETLKSFTGGFFKITPEPPNHTKVEPKLNLLDGTAGAALFLLAHQAPATEKFWSPIFFTDIHPQRL